MYSGTATCLSSLRDLHRNLYDKFTTAKPRVPPSKDSAGRYTHSSYSRSICFISDTIHDISLYLPGEQDRRSDARGFQNPAVYSFKN